MVVSVSSVNLTQTMLMTSRYADSGALRRALKARRLAVSPRYREQAARRAWWHLRYWPVLRRVRGVACYLAMPGEFPTDVIIAGLLRQGKRVYVPVIDSRRPRSMVFQQYRPGATLRRNRFGIAEPVTQPRRQLPPGRLDLVIMPLLGFDPGGGRLGMGGGFYDSHFAFRRQGWRHRKPWLLGLGYDAQRCDRLALNPWDVPLDAMLTESGLTLIRQDFRHRLSPKRQ